MTGGNGDKSGPRSAADLVTEAMGRIEEHTHRTPLLANRTLSEIAGAPIHLKCENLQRTGSYKVRGALNRTLTLPPETLARGVVTVSAGNHAQAVAWAAHKAGVAATVVMPASAPKAKVEGAEGYGARVVQVDDATAAFSEALRLAEVEGLYLLHPFDDPEVIAGQGTVGLEIGNQLPNVARVVVPVGGGGLISGITTWLEVHAPACEIWGVEPKGAAAMRASLDADRPVTLTQLSTIADGLAAPMAGRLNFEVVKRGVRDVVTVSDHDIGRAMRHILERCKLVVEPAGAAGWAALLSGAIPQADVPTVVVLSGGNVDPDRIPGYLAGH